MALFNHRDILTIQADASLHNKGVVDKELQPYNDILFKLIRDDVTARRETIVEEIRTKIRETPGKVVTVSVPLWSYNVRYFTKTKEQYNAELASMSIMDRFTKQRTDEELRKLHRANGWHWTIGTKFEGEEYWDDVLTEGGHLAWVMPENMERLPSVPVDLLVRKTDLLNRLATTMFPGYGWVVKICGKRLHRDDNCEVFRNTLHLIYSPCGLPENGIKSKGLHMVAVKYATHTDYKLPEGHKVVLKGPGLAP